MFEILLFTLYLAFFIILSLVACVIIVSIFRLDALLGAEEEEDQTLGNWLGSAFVSVENLTLIAVGMYPISSYEVKSCLRLSRDDLEDEAASYAMHLLYTNLDKTVDFEITPDTVVRIVNAFYGDFWFQADFENGVLLGVKDIDIDPETVSIDTPAE